MNKSKKLFMISGLSIVVGSLQHILRFNIVFDGHYTNWFGDELFTILFVVALVCGIIGLITMGETKNDK